MRIGVLSSGSAGNATLFEARGTRILVDAGIGPRALEREAEGRLPQAIVVTHAHEDHVGHAERIARRLQIPIYLSEATARVVHFRATTEVRRFSARAPFGIGALVVSPVPVPHDAAQVGLVIEGGGRAAALVTDLGEPTAQLLDRVRGCDVVLLESNHDPEMLERGPYPGFLKQRVRSARGHLSNQQTASVLARLGPRTRAVVLMHLSRTNNTEELALAHARDALRARKVRVLAAPPRGGLWLDGAEDHLGRRRAEQLSLSFC